MIRSSSQRCYITKAVLRSFAEFTGKQKKETLAQVFSREFPKISKNSFFTEHLRTTDSVWWMELFSKQDPSEMLDRVLNTFLKRAEAVNMKRKTILMYIPFSSYMRKLFKKILDPCRHTTLFQRRYDIVRHRTTSHQLWNDVVCLQGSMNLRGVFRTQSRI